MSIRIVLFGCFGMVVACGGSDGVSPRQACEDSASALCERFYACYTAQELASAGFPSSEAACVTTLQSQQGCAAETTQNICTGNAKYSPVEAQKCSDQITGLSCSQVRDPFFDEATAAPACTMVCAVH